MRDIDRRIEREVADLIDMSGLDPEEISSDQMREFELRARSRAEAAFDNWVDQGIDERKERKAFGDDE